MDEYYNDNTTRYIILQTVEDITEDLSRLLARIILGGNGRINVHEIVIKSINDVCELYASHVDFLESFAKPGNKKVCTIFRFEPSEEFSGNSFDVGYSRIQELIRLNIVNNGECKIITK